jgi:NAD(P)-dependent dehydrogenase (short-subunit alcohol dehydrogenase family)
MIELKGKTALVTGAGMGLGRSTALALARQGADVALADLKKGKPAEVARAVSGTKTMVLAMDVTSEESVDEAFQQVLAEWGHLDILVNNAGVSSAVAAGREEERWDADWDVTFDINVKGVVRCCRAAIPHMKDRRYGKIVNIASISGHSAHPRPGGAYGVSKASVLRYTKGLAKELGPFNINVNAVCPGAVWTDFHQQGWSRRIARDPQMAGKEPYQAFLEFYEKEFPLRRCQTPEDIASAVAFLVSEDACNITGQCLHVDGGLIIDD